MSKDKQPPMSTVDLDDWIHHGRLVYRSHGLEGMRAFKRLMVNLAAHGTLNQISVQASLGKYLDDTPDPKEPPHEQ